MYMYLRACNMGNMLSVYSGSLHGIQRRFQTGINSKRKISEKRNIQMQNIKNS